MELRKRLERARRRLLSPTVRSGAASIAGVVVLVRSLWEIAPWVAGVALATALLLYGVVFVDLDATQRKRRVNG